MRCIFLALDPTAAAAAGCSQASLAEGSPAQQALAGVFNPPCASLGSQACNSRPGCMLEPHGDHFDCKRTASYAAESLLTPESAVSVGGSEAAASQTSSSSSSSSSSFTDSLWAQAAQRAANSCRTAALAQCDLQVVDVKASRAALAMLAAASTGKATGAATLPGEVGVSAAPAPSSSLANGDGGIQQESTHDDEHHEGPDSQPLRIGSVFVVLAAGLVGCAAPVVLRVSSARGVLCQELYVR